MVIRGKASAARSKAKSSPVQSNAKATVADKKKSATKDATVNLHATPTSKEARTHIASYISAVRKGKQFTITNRGKPVAILGPLNSLPAGREFAETITTTDIATGKRSLGMVALHGPYLVQKLGKDVAALYASTTSPSQQAQNFAKQIEAMEAMAVQMQSFMAKMEEVGLLREAITRRLEVRKRADAAIRQRIEALRISGDDFGAEKLAAEFKRLDETI